MLGIYIGVGLGKQSHNITMPELVQDWDFSGEPAGVWKNLYYTTHTISGGEISVTTIDQIAGVYQAITTETGVEYDVVAYTTSGTSGYLLRINNGIIPAAAIVDIVPSGGVCVGSFTALSENTTLYIRMNTSGVSVWQSISVKKKQ